MTDHIIKAGVGLVLCAIIIMLFTTDNPELISDDTKAAFASIEFGSSHQGTMAAVQRRTLERARMTYQKHCELWHRQDDCDKARGL